MSFEEARENYLDALDELNRLVDTYNEKRKEHPQLGLRHRLENVPKETWGSHVTKRYAPRKMQSLRDGPLEKIKGQTKGSTISIKDIVVNTELSLIDRMLGKENPEELSDEIASLLDDIYDQAKRVERVSREVQHLAEQSEYHQTEE